MASTSSTGGGAPGPTRSRSSGASRSAVPTPARSRASSALGRATTRQPVSGSGPRTRTTRVEEGGLGHRRRAPVDLDRLGERSAAQPAEEDGVPEDRGVEAGGHGAHDLAGVHDDAALDRGGT